MKKARNKKKKNPPEGINHNLPRRNRPSLLVRQKLRPFDLPGRRFRVALYVFKFALGAVRMLLRCTVEQQPKNQPGKAESAGQEESPAPAQMDSDPGHNQRRDNCADVRAGVENSRRQCTLFFGNHSATLLMLAGKTPASPNPRADLAIAKPASELAIACPMEARLQKTMAIA